jgi:glycosyltransferase involved in cell wall biosynthesis
MNPQHNYIRQILMTADAAGGVWTYTLDLCASLNEFGIRICLAIMGAPLSSSQQTEAEQIPNLTVRQSTYKLEWMDDPWEDVEQAGRWLLALEKEIRPDLIHLNGYSHASLNWTAPVVIVAHSCVLSWWHAVKQENAPESWNVYQERVKQGLQRADAVVAVSHTYSNELQSVYGKISNLSVIYHGRNSQAFYVLEKKNQAFAMGRIWDEAKNLEILGKLSGKINLKILLAGDNTHPETKKKVDIHQVESLGLLSQSAIKKHLAESFIYIHPALYEPFGLSVLEAALSGCLLVLANIPTFQELWQNTALYFDPRNPDELEQVLKYIRQHPQVCRGLINRSSERARLYSVDTMGQHYYYLYESLVFSKSVHKEMLY